jgi:hypothetical protein
VGRLDLHCDGMAAEGVEDIGGPGEVEHQLARAGVRHALDLRCVASSGRDRRTSVIAAREPRHTSLTQMDMR